MLGYSWCGTIFRVPRLELSVHAGQESSPQIAQYKQHAGFSNFVIGPEGHTELKNGRLSPTIVRALASSSRRLSTDPLPGSPGRAQGLPSFRFCRDLLLLSQARRFPLPG